MKITDLEIRGFRAFTGEHSFKLDADVVLFTGANGRGKTSVFDAVLWTLTGSLSRLDSQDEDAPIISLYSDTGQARVSLQLKDGNNSVEIIRSDDGSEKQQVRVKTEKNEYRGEEAASWILTEFWPRAQTAEEASDAFSQALTRSVYLQQDLVRQFVEADTARQRFDAVSELVGAGRISELNSKLDTQRRNWTSRTNDLKDEIEDTREEFETAKSQRQGLGASEDEDLDELRNSWEKWWSDAQDLGIDREPANVQDSDASSAIDEAIKNLNSLRRQAKRSLSEASELLDETEEIPEVDELPDIEPLEESLSKARKEKEDAEETLAEAKESAAKKRREQLQQKEEIDELATLAELALRHVEGRCPVCQQTHSTEQTRQHLESLIERAGEENGESPPDIAKIVEEELARVSEAEEAVADAEDELERAREMHKRVQQHEDELRDWLDNQNATLGEDESITDAVERVQKDVTGRIDALESHVEIGEQLSLRLATVAQESRREELTQEIEELEAQLNELERELDSREEASDLADTFVDKLEDATKEFVTRRLEDVSSLLQKIYSKVDPHPTFRAIRLITSFSHRRGRLDPYVVDPDSDIGDHDPFKVMSSSQINVVALSIFLSLNLGIPNLPLKTLMLDDPLQSLDDINFLGFIDLIRRIRGGRGRQVFLSTHDDRLSGLLKRKLRPVKESQQTRVFSFLDWTREGPEIAESVIEREESPMRLVAA